MNPAKRSSLDESSLPVNAWPTLPVAPVTRIRCMSVTTPSMNGFPAPLAGLGHTGLVDAEVVVIGAGALGLSTALHCALAGRSVAVVERSTAGSQA